MKPCVVLALIIFWTSAAFALTPNQWQYRQSINLPGTGLVQINLPPATSNIARPDLSDLRIIDFNEKEIPFLIDQPTPRPESSVPVTDFRADIVAAETRLLITTNGASTTAGVVLDTPASANFIKAARVEGSNDQKDWRVLRSGAPLFRMGNGAVNLRVVFPEGRWHFLRVVVDDNRTPPIPWTSARLIVAGSSAPTEPVSVTIKSRDENPGTTRLGIDLSDANLRIASIRIGTSEPVFTRSVTVAAPELSAQNLQEEILSSAVLYRVDVNGKVEAHLDLPIDKQIFGRELVLLIDNGDSPPLLISEVRADRRITRLIFFAATPGAYSLLSGNNQCESPRYDLGQLGDQLRGAGAIQGQVGLPAPNPGYNPAESLPQDFAAGAKIDVTPWKFCKQIQIAQPGAQQVELDPDVLARAAPDFRDLRVVSENTQVPYLIECTSIERTVQFDVRSANDPKRSTLSRWQLKLPQALPLRRVSCASTSALFERTFRFWEELTDERGDQYARELAQTTWQRVPNQPSRQLAVSFAGPPKTDTVLIETDNGDNPPIELQDFRGYYPVTRIIFVSSKSQSIKLFYGNEEAPAPRYDAKLMAAQTLRSKRAPAALGPQEILKSERMAETLTESTRYAFWGVLGIVVIALLVLISRLLPKTA